MKLGPALIGILLTIIGIIITISIWITSFPYEGWPLIILLLLFIALYFQMSSKLKSSKELPDDPNWRFNR